MVDDKRLMEPPEDARLAAHRARRGVKLPKAERLARKAATGGPEALTTNVECARCGAPLPGREWARPRPRMRAGALDLAVCAGCDKQLAETPHADA